MDLKGCSRKCPSSLNLKTRLREVLTACRKRRAQRTKPWTEWLDFILISLGLKLGGPVGLSYLTLNFTSWEYPH